MKQNAQRDIMLLLVAPPQSCPRFTSISTTEISSLRDRSPFADGRESNVAALHSAIGFKAIITIPITKSDLQIDRQ